MADETKEQAAAEAEAERQEQILQNSLDVVKLERKVAQAKRTKAGAPRSLKAQLRDKRLRARAFRDGLEVTKDERGRVVAIDPEEEAS